MGRQNATVFLGLMVFLVVSHGTAKAQEDACIGPRAEADCGSTYSLEAHNKLRHEEELRIVVVGKTGVGKSSTINTIAGKKLLKSAASPSSVTFKVDSVNVQVEGKSLLIVDTPGIFDTNFDVNETMKELTKVMIITSPGFHVFLIVIRLNRFTEEEAKSVQILAFRFGPELFERAVIVFTGYDDLQADDTSFENFIDDSNDVLKELINKCGNRVIPFNNRLPLNSDASKQQVRKLLGMVDQVLESKNHTCYTNEIYKAVEKKLNEEIDKREEEERRKMEELQRMIEELLAEKEKRKEAEEKAKRYQEELRELKVNQASRSDIRINIHNEAKNESGSFLEFIGGALWTIFVSWWWPW